MLYALPEAFQSIPILSPGRKYLAGFMGGASGGTIRFLDAATGQRMGEITTPSADDGGKPGLLAGAFRPDGEQFAALLNGNQLARFDLKTGNLVSEFRSPAPPGPLLEWCGPRHLLVNNFSLIDLDRQWEVWRYPNTAPCQGSPDSRHWAIIEPYTSSPAFLAAVDIPDKKLEKIVALVTDKKAPALVRAGTSISLRVDASGPPKDGGAFARSVAEQFMNQLRAYDISVEDGQVVTMIVRADEIDTGFKQELRSFMAGFDKDNAEGKKPVSIKTLEYDITFVDASGKATLEPKQTIGPRDLVPLVIPPGTQDPDKYVSQQLWRIARSRLANVVVPPFVSRQPDGLVRFPGSSNLANVIK
jgi:hypothetical protein